MNRERIREQLILHEGLRLKPYRCTSDKLTIGVGRNLDDRGISKTTAMQMLDEDIAIVFVELQNIFEDFGEMPDIIQESLIDLAFNMGTPTLLKFKAAVRALKAHQWGTAADEILNSRYARQVGQRAQTIADNIRSCG